MDKNEVIRNPSQISEKYNKYFAEIGLQISNKASTNNASNFRTYLRSSASQSIFPEPPKPNEIFDIILSLNVYKARGYDNISSFFLRLGDEVLVPILSV